MNSVINQPIANGQAGVSQQGQAPMQMIQPQVQQAQNVQAMFTQEQLNSIIQGRVNPLNQRITDLNAQLAQSQQLAQSYLTELTGYKNRETAVNAGIPSPYVDFAVFEATKLAVNGKSFEDAIKEFAVSNKQLFMNTQMGNQVSPVQTPNGVVTTQAVVNPAQVAQGQAVQNYQNTQYAPQVANQASPTQTAPTQVANQGVVYANAVNTAQGYAGQAQQIQPQQIQPQPQAMAMSPALPVQPLQMQTGSTVMGYANSPAVVNTVASEVTEFLKTKGIGK